MPSSYVVGEHFEHFIHAQVESGRYAGASEVVREALRLMEDQERLRELHIAELRRQVQEGMNSGPGIPAEEVFARLEAKYETMVEQRESA
ncbi:MAG: type II toxin-antitoxin system ParD family antitoxin [Pseudomonadota bacterium]|nr:type II toxin-antitoxin system ParD family antitoxin [Pseudomonadota bacterium]